MQIELPESEDEVDALELTLIPPPSTPSPSEIAGTPKTPVQLLYDAIAACSDLHPDMADEDDEDEEDDDRIIFEGSRRDHEAIEGFSGVLRGTSNGGLPPPMPGSSGWITAENVDQYFDAQGNWLGDGEEDDDQDGGVDLGQGAGRVRGRDEVEGEDEANGHGAEDDSEAKRARVD